MDKNKLTPWEAKRNLSEMVEKIGPEHAREVENKISDAIFQEINLNYGDTIYETLEDTIDFCSECHSEFCNCT